MVSALLALVWRLVLLAAALLARLPRGRVTGGRSSGRPPRPAPAHVALLLPPDPRPQPLRPLAHLLLWSLAAGVRTFTYYDPTGALKKNEDKLIEAVEQLKVNTTGDIKWNSKPARNGYKNGTDRKISVNVLSSEDGKRRFVSAVRDMCRADGIDPVNVDRVDDCVRNAYPLIPEPNLAIYCGERCCTNGFLPWQIRLTEFLGLGDLETVKLDRFTELLREYGKCEQRFGK